MYPNSSQKTLLRQWMGCARLVYNMVVNNYHLGHRTTRQFFFRMLLQLKIKHTKEWIFIDKFNMKYWIMLYKQETRLSHGIRRININITFFVLDLRKMTVRRLPSVPNTVANHSVFISGSYIIRNFLLLILIIHVTK